MPRHVQNHDELDLTETASLSASDFIPPGRGLVLRQLPAEAMNHCCPAGRRSAYLCSGIPWRITLSRGHGP